MSPALQAIELIFGLAAGALSFGFGAAYEEATTRGQPRAQAGFIGAVVMPILAVTLGFAAGRLH